MPKVQVRYYRIKNKLKEKSAGLGLKDGEIPVFDDEILAEVQAALDEMSEEYPDWVSSLIDQLYVEQKGCLENEENRRAHFSKIHDIAHDMKGQGGTFGYPLITDFSDGLYNFTIRNSGLSDSHVEIVKAHIDAMRVVIKERVNGDGGEIGSQLKVGLAAAIDKFDKQAVA